MKSTVSNSFIALALGLSFAACSSDESKSGNTDAGNAGAAAGGSSASSTGGAPGADGASGGAGGDVHHGGSSGASGSAGASGHMTGSGGMAHEMTDGAMMDGSMMDGGPYALVIDSVMPLEGGLHVMWTNHRGDCDKIELWRNKNGGQYALAYTLVASADSQHDAQATSPGKYCYKARCVKASTYSESNEKCGTP